MFEAEAISKLNELEMLAFDYLVKESKKVQEMTIRDFAATIHVSTSTIIRMSNKLGFSGWADLKYFLKSKGTDPVIFDNYFENMISLDLFWNKIKTQSFQNTLNKAVKLIIESNYLIFLGVGTSDSLAQYGARYFNNLGISSFVINDIFRPVVVNEFNGILAIVLSVSGETSQVVAKTLEFKQAGAKIVTVTNNEDSTLSKMADLNFSYNMINEYAKTTQDVKLTTQLPVVAILEIIAHRVHQSSKKTII